MGTYCLTRYGVVLSVADDRRSSFMTNGHLPPVGGASVLPQRLVCPSSAARYSRRIPILREFHFPHLTVCLLQGDSSVHRPRFAMPPPPYLHKFRSPASRTQRTLAADLAKLSRVCRLSCARLPIPLLSLECGERSRSDPSVGVE